MDTKTITLELTDEQARNFQLGQPIRQIDDHTYRLTEPRERLNQGDVIGVALSELRALGDGKYEVFVALRGWVWDVLPMESKEYWCKPGDPPASPYLK